MRNNPIIPTLFVIGVSLSACSSMPEQHSVLEEARSNYSEAQSDPDVTNYAAVELQEAGEALERAENAWSEKEDAELVDHLAYLSRQRALIAQDTGKLRSAEVDIANADSRRAEILLKARTAEADVANKRVSEMEKKLTELNAQKTKRGLVITLGDILFDFNKAELKPGGERNVQKIADFLLEYPERKVMIEGFTDSMGSDSYNQALSERRAEAVRRFLIANGVSANRIAARGYGESYPVASNETAGTRQLNRRVEIYISEDESDIAPR